MPATVLHTARTFPFGEEMAAQHAGGAYATRYKFYSLSRTCFGSKELDPQTGYYYYGARYYDPVISRWLNVDPLAEKYPGFSAYNFTLNNPVMRIDNDGKKENPIYDKHGNFLGTDDKGLQGEAIIMRKEDFKQGMSHDEALKKGRLFSQLSTEEQVNMVNWGMYDHWKNLKNRPDWDGKITWEEAKEWYRTGGGQPLYVDASKIDLSPLTVKDFEKKKSRYINFAHPRYANFETGLVYGTIKVTLLDNHGSVCLGNCNTNFLDRFDFEQQRNRTFRNFATRIGRFFAGEGTPFEIYTYGIAHIDLPSNTRLHNNIML